MAVVNLYLNMSRKELQPEKSFIVLSPDEKKIKCQGFESAKRLGLRKEENF
jgi:hypothetical protein